MTANQDILFITVAILTIIYIILSINVIRNRRHFKVLYGANKNIELKAAIRAHANFAEYVPLTIILFAGLIFYNISLWLFICLNALFLISRCIHSVGIVKCERSEQPQLKPRFYGMVGTFLVMGFSAVYILTKVFILNNY